MKKRPHVSAEFAELVEDFHLLRAQKTEANGHLPELDVHTRMLAREIILRYQRGERVSLRAKYSAVAFERSAAAVPAGFVAVNGYLVASNAIDELERLILGSDEREDIRFSFRAHRCPY